MSPVAHATIAVSTATTDNALANERSKPCGFATSLVASHACSTSAAGMTSGAVPDHWGALGVMPTAGACAGAGHSAHTAYAYSAASSRWSKIIGFASIPASSAAIVAFRSLHQRPDWLGRGRPDSHVRQSH